MGKPRLRFTPAAYAKYIWFRDRGDTEISAMGISSEDDPLLVEDIRIVKQKSSAGLTTFDDDGFAEFIEDMILDGYDGDRVGRIWLHTHPGFSATPSGMDKNTFEEKFGKCTWAIMCILSNDEANAWISANIAGVRLESEMIVEVDWFSLLDDLNCNTKDWEKEYKKIKKVEYPKRKWGQKYTDYWDDPLWDDPSFTPKKYRKKKKKGLSKDEQDYERRHAAWTED